MGLRGGRWIVLTTLPLFLGLYVFYVYFFPHYVVVVAPAITVGILIGAEELGAAHPAVRAALSLIIVGTAIAALPQFDANLRDQMFDAPSLRVVNEKLAAIKESAVVLFTDNAEGNVDEELVYNADVAWPDDAGVIRANDLGMRNSQIFKYYGQRQPDRAFYRFDEMSETLIPLGRAKNLAGMSP